MTKEPTVDVILIGAGAMSTCLGTLLNQFDPSLEIIMIERLGEVAQESTDSMNNAGTGHAGNCELNYTAENEDGSINPDKAYEINVAFEISLQLWSYLVEKGVLPEPEKFINRVPHESFVWGEDNVEFLRKRYEVMSKSHLFSAMEFSDDPAVIREWLPLVMNNRDPNEKVAATRIQYGSDVNFGKIAHSMTEYLCHQNNFELKLNTHVSDLNQLDDGTWNVITENYATGDNNTLNTKFVFLGVGGGALPLLQKSDIPEADGYAGFPVSGHWLVCEKPEIVEQHLAKVYGKAPVGAPPMSVPHLDTRVLGEETDEAGNTVEKKALLFGPFAGFTTKFLKYGSNLDLIKSTTFGNIKPMAMVGIRNLELTKYLISESLQSHTDRVDSLRDYYPDVKEDDWKLESAGQRVQIIKRCDDKGGKLEFGTEVVTSADNTLAALLGASPGASITAKTMIEIIETCFAERLESEEWQEKMIEMVPSYKQSLIEDIELHKKIRSRTLATLQLD